MTLLQSGITKSLAEDYTIDQSLRFVNDGTETGSSYLTRTPTVTGNRKTWTYSCWLKRGQFIQSFFGLTAYNPSGNARTAIQFSSTGKIDTSWNPDGSDNETWVSTAQYRDPGAWYHIVVAMDTTQSTANDRQKIYVNGELLTDYDTRETITEDSECPVNQAGMVHEVGHYAAGHTDFVGWDGLLAEVYFIDGQQLAASSFGETDSTTNQWKPIDASGLTFGTNGFYLKFEDSADLGNDSSGEGNDYTPTNLVATDQMVDSPTNNFCTLNSVFKSLYGTSTLSEGNLKYYSTGDNHSVGTIPVSSGKWYFEVYNVQLNQTSASGYGVLSADSNGIWLDGIEAHYQTNGPANRIYIDGSYTQTGITGAANGDIVGVAFNLDDDEIDFYVNNTQTGVTASLTSGYKNWIPYLQNGNSSSNKTFVINFGQDSSFAEYKTAQGNADGNGIGDFYYEPPTDYLALCTSNLSAPSIKLPGDNFNTVLYTGDGATTLAVTGVGFQPDFTWIKNRDATDNNIAVDAVRGANNYLVTNTTAAEVDDSTFVASLDSDGFTVGDDVAVNTNTENYVSWNWLGANGTVTNTDGTNIDSTVSANTAAGFSICTYTGTGTNADSFGHGLSSAPELVIIKSRESPGWQVGSTPVGWTKYLVLDTAAAAATSSVRWNDTAPSASVVTLGTSTNVNASGFTYVAYCFHSVEGYSKVGSYTGNGNADGTFIYTGFRPAFFLIKSYSATPNWAMEDNKRNPYNQQALYMEPNTNNVEKTTGYLDFVSNGIKLRNTLTRFNQDTGTNVYLAIAEFPFKFASAR